MADGLFKPMEDLAQDAEGLYFAPIRHHSPACAWAVREMIAEVEPDHVLIEAPIDLEQHIPALLDPVTKPPVAIASLIERDKENRVAAYLPFCAHSPELVALAEGARIGAELHMVDLPSTRLLGIDRATAGQTVPIATEEVFDSGTYIDALKRRFGCRDGFELWDHLFETRLGESDWREFFRAVGTYCAGIRAATPEAELSASGHLARESHMSAAILKAQKTGRVVVVAGGFHIPALVDPTATPKAVLPEPRGAAKSYLIRYGFEALDALAGYAAGLPQPAYYDDLWHLALAHGGPPKWEERALELVSRFATKMRQLDHIVPVPAQIEVLRLANGLARMRDRPGAMRHDLIDAVRTALVKGEVAATEIWTERLVEFLRGHALGEVPPSTGAPPLLDDVRRRVGQLKLDITDSARRRRSLDIRRNAAHLATSQFLHAMTLIGSGFALREAGPDFIQGRRTDLLFEDWSYAWSPGIEGRLIEIAVLGDDLPSACLDHLKRSYEEMVAEGKGRDLSAMTMLLAQGLLAGLGGKLSPFVAILVEEIRVHGTFVDVAHALSRLQYLSLSKGPLSIPETLAITDLRNVAYLRLVYLCDELPLTKVEQIPDHLEGLRLVIEILCGQESDELDASLFHTAIDRVAHANPPPEILGAVLAICVQSGWRSPQSLLAAMVGNFNGALIRSEARIGVLRGLLSAAPSLLWTINCLLDEVDSFLISLDDETFQELLPHLRFALTALNPRETDRVAQIIGKRYHSHTVPLTKDTGFTERDLAVGLAADRAIREAADADGLSDWLGHHE